MKHLLNLKLLQVDAGVRFSSNINFCLFFLLSYMHYALTLLALCTIPAISLDNPLPQIQEDDVAFSSPIYDNILECSNTQKCDDTFKSASAPQCGDGAMSTSVSECVSISKIGNTITFNDTEDRVPSISPLRAQRSLSDPLVTPSQYPLPSNVTTIIPIVNQATNNSNKVHASSSRHHHSYHQSTNKHASRLQTLDVTGDAATSVASTSRRSPRRSQRHSIAGQMSYFKMLGFGFGKKMASTGGTAAAAGGLFSTAVISGSSSAPNLRDMIASTASPSGKIID